MSDLAELVIKVNSSDLQQSNKLLIDYSKAGENAQRSTDKLTQESQKMGHSLSSVNSEVIRQTASMTAQKGSAEDLTNRMILLSTARDKFADPTVIERYNRKIQELANQRTKLESFGMSTETVFKELGQQMQQIENKSMVFAHFDANSAKVRAVQMAMERLLREGVEPNAREMIALRKQYEMLQGSGSGMNRELGRTGFLLNNIGYLVQDAPFAVMSGNIGAVANNIPMVLNGFQYMMRDGKSLGQVFSEIGSAMMGPMGLIFLFGSLLPSAIMLARSGIFDLGKDSKDTKKAVDEMTSSLEQYNQTLYSLQSTSVSDPLGLRKMKADIGNLNDLKNTLNSMSQLQFAIQQKKAGMNIGQQSTLSFGLAGLAGQTSVGGNQDYKQQAADIDSMQRALSDLQKVYGNLSKSQLDEIQKKIEDTKNTLLLRQALVNSNPILKEQVQLTDRANSVLRDYNLGLHGSKAAIETLRDSVGARISQLRNQNHLSEQQKELLQVDVNVYKALTNAIGDAKKATDGFIGSTDRVATVMLSGFGGGMESVKGGPFAKLAEQFDFINTKAKLIGPQFDSIKPKISAVEQAINDIMQKNPNDDRLPSLINLLRDLQAQSDKATKAAHDLGFTFSSAFEDAIIGGKRLSDVLQGLAQDVERIVLRTLITQPLGNALSSGLSNLFGASTGKAIGGDVMAGNSYWVGENGPEIYTPSQNGTITPNSQAGANVQVNIINENGSQVDVQKKQTGNSIEITAIVRNAVKDQMNRGAFDVNFKRNYGISRVGRNG